MTNSSELQKKYELWLNAPVGEDEQYFCGLVEAAEGGLPTAQEGLAKHYAFDDWDLSFKWAIKAYKNGMRSTAIHVILGTCYASGYGTIKDEHKALSYFQSAPQAEPGSFWDKQLNVNLAIQYVPQNAYAEPAEWKKSIDYAERVLAHINNPMDFQDAKAAQILCICANVDAYDLDKAKEYAKLIIEDEDYDRLYHEDAMTVLEKDHTLSAVDNTIQRAAAAFNDGDFVSAYELNNELHARYGKSDIQTLYFRTRSYYNAYYANGKMDLHEGYRYCQEALNAFDADTEPEMRYDISLIEHDCLPAFIGNYNAVSNWLKLSEEALQKWESSDRYIVGACIVDYYLHYKDDVKEARKWAKRIPISKLEDDEIKTLLKKVRAKRTKGEKWLIAIGFFALFLFILCVL